MQSQKNGISFYEMAFIITDKQMTKKRAQEWLKTKEISVSENQGDPKDIQRNIIERIGLAQLRLVT